MTKVSEPKKVPPPIEPSGLQATIDPKTGCVLPAPFRDRDGRLLEWIPWNEL
jgi:hypothetical protein